MNLYDLAKKMWEIDAEIQILNDKLKIASLQDRGWIERSIDSKLAEFLSYKHKMEMIDTTIL